MGLITGHTKYLAKVSYDVVYWNGQERHYELVGMGLKTSQAALKSARRVRAMHRTPEITRNVRFPNTDINGYLLKLKRSPPSKRVTMRDLERIARDGEGRIPFHMEPEVSCSISMSD